MSNQPDIRDVPASWDYNLMMILATVFVLVAIIFAWTKIDSIKTINLNEQGKPPITAITTPDGSLLNERDMAGPGITDIVEIKLTSAEVEQYHQIKQYLGEGDVSLKVESQAQLFVDKDEAYEVMAGERDFVVFKEIARKKRPPAELEWYLKEE